jgi:hypothetical protein
MPIPEEILNGLALAANKFTALSIAWHIIVLLFLILLISGKKFNKKIIGSGLGIFLLSVGIIAVLVENPFNAIMFAVAAFLFGAYNLKFKPVKIGVKWDLVSVAGLVMVIFGFIYPHFLDGDHFYKYLYSSPMGLIPCPTLSVFIGFTMMFGGFHSKKWMITTALFGLFYGIFGVVRLKVDLDIMLIAGSFFLLVYSFIGNRKEADSE